MTPGPVDVKVDIDLSAVPPEGERLVIGAPAREGTLAVLGQPRKTGSAAQARVESARSGANSARIATTVRVPGWLTRDGAVAPVRQIEPVISICFETLKEGAGRSVGPSGQRHQRH